jgi:hypothetical protein|tara:strand:- start:620 stop:1480 length:861 start_codon:yes stop_codon:yes gene_type:complete
MADVFVPLNAFKSIVTALTGEDDQIYTTPSGVSTIILSTQVTNNGNKPELVTIKIASNRKIPVPQVADIINTGSMYSASALLDENLIFLKKEVAAYTSFNNNLSDIPFGFSQSRYEEYVDTSVTAVVFDVKNGGTLRTNKAAFSFYNKNGETFVPISQTTASYDAINYTNILTQQILLNQSITGSVNVERIYQSIYTQSFNYDLIAETGSQEIISQLFTVVSNTIYDPIRETQTPVEFVRNFPIPVGDSFSPVVAGKLVLEQEFGLVFSGSSDIKVVLSLLESANE